MLKLIWVFALSAALSGCVTGERMQGVREGMSKDDVIGVLGNPDGFRRSGEYEALRYTNRLADGRGTEQTTTSFSAMAE